MRLHVWMMLCNFSRFKEINPEALPFSLVFVSSRKKEKFTSKKPLTNAVNGDNIYDVAPMSGWIKSD
jgi:hypothetical protein